MKTDNILTALGEFSGSSDIPVSLIRHSARRAANRNKAIVQTTAARVIALPFARRASCTV